MHLPLKIALRYLRAKKAHSAVNIISLISVCGVVVATAALVCVLSVFNGFSQLVGSKLAVLDPDLTITAASGKAIDHADAVVQKVNEIGGVECALPVIEDNALASVMSRQLPVRLKGVPHNYGNVVTIDSAIIDGEVMFGNEYVQYAVLGVVPAITLDMRPGFADMIYLYAPQRTGRVNVANPATAFRTDSVMVAGVFQIEQEKYDRDVIFVSIDLARRIFKYPHQATSIEVRLAPAAQEHAVMSAISEALGAKFVVRNRLMLEDEAFRMINIEKWVSFLLLAFILVIATFNVIGALSLLIIEKQDSIGIFRSLGATNKQIRSIFIMEGWVISLSGAVLGVVLGLVLCSLQEHFGLITMQSNSALLLVDAYPVVVVWYDILIVFALVAAVGLFTSMVTSLIMRRLLR